MIGLWECSQIYILLYLRLELISSDLSQQKLEIVAFQCQLQQRAIPSTSLSLSVQKRILLQCRRCSVCQSLISSHPLPASILLFRIATTLKHFPCTCQLGMNVYAPHSCSITPTTCVLCKSNVISLSAIEYSHSLDKTRVN